jgi:hypothetical protein
MVNPTELENLAQPETARKLWKKLILTAITLAMSWEYGSPLLINPSLETLEIQLDRAFPEVFQRGEIKATSVAAILTNVANFAMGFTPYKHPLLYQLL